VTPRQERRQQRRDRDPAKYRADRSAERRRSRHRQRTLVFNHYGWSCACCGATGRPTIDHVNGDGAEHRRALGNHGSYRTYRWLIVHRFPAGFQTLCEPCNQSKDRGPGCRIDHGRDADVVAMAA